MARKLHRQCWEHLTVSHQGQVVPGASPGEWVPDLSASLSITDFPLVLHLKVSEATNDHCLDPHCHWELQNRDFSNSLIPPVFVS